MLNIILNLRKKKSFMLMKVISKQLRLIIDL